MEKDLIIWNRMEVRFQNKSEITASQTNPTADLVYFSLTWQYKKETPKKAYSFLINFSIFQFCKQ